MGAEMEGRTVVCFAYSRRKEVCEMVKRLVKTSLVVAGIVCPNLIWKLCLKFPYVVQAVCRVCELLL
jgi:hypothetical protein